MRNPGALTARRRLHAMLLLAVVAVLAPAAVAYVALTRRLPSRGYTALGMTLGIVACLATLSGFAYILRKRRLQERLPGKLSTWLIVHAWVTSAGVVAALLHAGLHLDGGWGTWALAALGVAAVSGAFGLARYVSVPPEVAATVGNLASTSVESEIAALREQMEEAAAGHGDAFRAAVGRVAGGAPAKAPPGLSTAEAAAWAQVAGLAARRDECVARLSRQQRLASRMRGWLLVHVPASLLFVALLAVHVTHASGIVRALREPEPSSFPGPKQCATCHPRQFAEWSESMHAMAMSSPVTELQNLAVVLKERGLLREDPSDAVRPSTSVGTFCVDCHAPLSRVGTTERDPLIPLSQRSPATRLGVTCVACHQLATIHGGDGAGDAPVYANAESLEYRPGPTMYGPLPRGGDDDRPSVGNARHRGARWEGAAANPAALCASCHTVTIAPHGSDGIVALQDTYRQWQDSGWPGRASCLDCHARDMTPVAQVARDHAARRVPIDETREAVIRAIQSLGPPDDALAAVPADGFDLPLQPRRRYEHLFVGVDYALEPDLPFPGEAATNDAIRARHRQRVASLLAIAAALRIEDVQPGEVVIEIANLATGHPMPAGFAFARQSWLEVAVREAGASDYTVLLGGGGDGRPLEPSRDLPSEPGLRNFQAVLWNGRERADGGETVLQNEVRKVLSGQAARDHGFADREAALEPIARDTEAPVRPRRIALPVPRAFAPGDTVRVRLLHRNLPPEFLEQLARRLESGGEGDAAARCRRLIDALEIVEMTRDEVTVVGPSF